MKEGELVFALFRQTPYIILGVGKHVQEGPSASRSG